MPEEIRSANIDAGNLIRGQAYLAAPEECANSRKHFELVGKFDVFIGVVKIVYCAMYRDI